MKYFLDCGAHRGESILKAKRLYPGAYIHSFEPLEYFCKNLEKIHKDDDTVQINNYAVWIEDCVQKFYISETVTCGSSLHKVNANYFKGEELYCVDAQCIDLSQWIINNFDKEDYIILKLDTEGSEYDILSKMIEDGSIEYVNELLGEWHQVHDYRKDMLDKINEYLLSVRLPLIDWEENVPGEPQSGMSDLPTDFNLNSVTESQLCENS